MECAWKFRESPPECVESAWKSCPDFHALSTHWGAPGAPARVCGECVDFFRGGLGPDRSPGYHSGKTRFSAPSRGTLRACAAAGHPPPCGRWPGRPWRRPGGTPAPRRPPGATPGDPRAPPQRGAVLNTDPLGLDWTRKHALRTMLRDRKVLRILYALGAGGGKVYANSTRSGGVRLKPGLTLAPPRRVDFA